VTLLLVISFFSNVSFGVSEMEYTFGIQTKVSDGDCCRGTLSVSVSIVDNERGWLSSAIADYPRTVDAMIRSMPLSRTKII
jgi:hypothetical protein